MKFVKYSLFFFVSIFVLRAGLALFPTRPVYADNPSADPPSPQTLVPVDPLTGEIIGLADTTPPVFLSANPLLTPANGLTVTNFSPTFDWDEATDDTGVVSYTLIITTDLAETLSLTTTGSAYTPTGFLSNGVYTWTVQAHDAAGNSSGHVTPPYTFTIQADWAIYLPIIVKPEPSVCPTSSDASFELIPIDGSPADHPDYLHGDLNLSLRGYDLASGFLGLVSYSGGVDTNAPQLAGLFEPNRFPGVSAVYQVYNWNWACGGHGCPGTIITNPPVTLAELIVTPGEAISIPERSPNIYSGNYKVMVLYAEEQRLTLGYTRQDTVANGYAVHLENICVDPNLLAFYRAQVDAEGWHTTGRLPALRNNQALGTALGNELRIAIRDRGSFMDPRSQKDWWQGY